MPRLDLIEENTKMVRNFKPLRSEEMMQMSEALSGKNKMALDHYFHHHYDQFAGS
ncbi:MAG: hypothetical protein JWO80_3654 [Bryobacterales bacterium]|nr:hypothetical protein [Bryobacterales bacterium]